MAVPLIAAGIAGKAVAKKIVKEVTKKTAKATVKKTTTKATTKSPKGPQLSDYGKRYYTDSLTKQEAKDLHKWRMKNDLDYKNEISFKKNISKKNK